MLYISRYLGSNQYGVVDTDDDVETVVDFAELTDIVTALLKIEGVSTRFNSLGVEYITTVRPYQDNQYYTALQAKTKALSGVDIRTWRDEIVFIRINGDVGDKDVYIRLSQFGKKINGYLPVEWSGKANHKVFLVIDDNINAVEMSPCTCIMGVRMDIHECSDEQLVEYMYLELMSTGIFSEDKWGDYVIDKPERQQLYRCVALLNGGFMSESTFAEKLEQIGCSETVCKLIADKYRMRFTTIAYAKYNATYLLIEHHRPDLISMIRTEYSNRPFGVEHYEDLRKSFIGIFKMLADAAAGDASTLQLFARFIKFFEVPTDIKELYVKLCNNIADTLNDYCIMNGIPLRW